MPIDDLRTRPPAARPVVDEADDDLDDIDHGGELDLTPEQLKEIEAAQIAEAVRRLKDYDEGREVAIPWEEAAAYIFGPPTPDEVAEDAARAKSRRARR